LRREEEVEAMGLVEEVEAMRQEEEDLDEDGGQDPEEEEEEDEDKEVGHEEGHEDDAGLYDEGAGVMSLLKDTHPHTELGLATSFSLL
jgi:hypothetical protein